MFIVDHNYQATPFEQRRALFILPALVVGQSACWVAAWQLSSVFDYRAMVIPPLIGSAFLVWVTHWLIGIPKIPE